MIITCIDIIEQFYYSKGNKPDTGIETSLNNNIFQIPCAVTKYDEFITQRAELVEKPFLSIVSGETRKGFGLAKAEAIISVRDDIQEFISKYDQSYNPREIKDRFKKYRHVWLG